MKKHLKIGSVCTAFQRLSDAFGVLAHAFKGLAPKEHPDALSLSGYVAASERDGQKINRLEGS
jgi:hypothetical protein